LPALLAAALALAVLPMTAAPAAPVVHATIRSAMEAAAQDQSLALAVFSATWCAPCKKLKAETLGSAEFQEQAGALHLAEIDVDAEAALARDYSVSSVPTLVILTPDGKIVCHTTGFLRTADLLLWLREARQQAQAGKWEGTVPGSQLAALSARAVADRLDTNDLLHLTALLGDPASADREAAARILSGQRELAVGPLIDALTNSYLGVRIGAAELLRRMAPESPVMDPWSPAHERIASADSVRQWWKKTGKLLPATNSSFIDPARLSSVNAAIQLLRQGTPQQRTEAMSALAAHGAPALPSVRQAIKMCEQAGDQRSLALLEEIRWTILIPGELDQQVIGARRALALGAGTERQAAAERLGKAGNAALPALVELAADSDALVVESAIRALGALGGKEAVPAIAQLLKSGDSNLRMTAAQALGHARSRLAIPNLIQLFDDDDEIVACAAMAAVEEIAGINEYSSSGFPLTPELALGLKNGMKDSRWRVRAAAAETVGKLRAAEALDGLRALLDDADGFVVKSTLRALRTLKASPEPARLLAVAKRHPALREEVMGLLLSWGTADAAAAVADRYHAGSPEERLEILRGLCSGSEGNPEGTNWQALLAEASAEPGAQLRRAAVKAIGAQPGKVAAALVGRLLADDDQETRTAAAGVVLSIVAGQRLVVRSDSHTHGGSYERWLGESEEEESDGNTRKKTNTPSATPIQLAGWNTQLRSKPTPEPLTAAAIFVTSTNSADLSLLEESLDQAEPAALARLGRSAAITALAPRLSWPQAQPVVEKLCRTPFLFFKLATGSARTAPQLKAFLFEPKRFRQAADAAAGEDLEPYLSKLLSSNSGGWSLLSPGANIEAVALSLLESTNAIWRAAALHALSAGKDERRLPLLLKSCQDTNVWVRLAAANGLAKCARNRDALESGLGPLLEDGERNVVRCAASGLLEPETRTAANMEYGSGYFRYDQLTVWSTYSSSSSDQRPLAVLTNRPAFLETARRQAASANASDGALLTLLLAQYGDFSGLDKLLPQLKSESQRNEDLPALLFTAVALSRDAKFLPFLQQAAAAAKDESDFRRLLQALKGMSGPDVRELRLLINKRMRQGSQ
jgi:HEAT repeat protein